MTTKPFYGLTNALAGAEPIRISKYESQMHYYNGAAPVLCKSRQRYTEELGVKIEHPGFDRRGQCRDFCRLICWPLNPLYCDLFVTIVKDHLCDIL